MPEFIDLTTSEAAELDDRVSIHWPPGTILVMRQGDHLRPALIRKYYLDHDGDVKIACLMIDIILAYLDGTRAGCDFSPSQIVRRIESWDILELKKLAFPADLRDHRAAHRRGRYPIDRL